MRGAVGKARLTGQRSQQTFDVLLRTLAEPGTVRSVPPGVLEPEIPAPGWLALALGDVDVTVNVGDDPDHPLGHLVRDATGAQPVPLDEAWLVILPEPTADQLARACTGDALNPERGARVALGVASLHEGGDGELDVTLEGPGVPGQRTLGIDGLDAGLLGLMGRASGEFPVGFDTWLFAPDGRVTAISRSTTVRKCGDRRTDQRARGGS